MGNRRRHATNGGQAILTARSFLECSYLGQILERNNSASFFIPFGKERGDE